MLRRFALIAAMFFTLAAPAAGQDAAQQSPCEAQECRQFDFWLGDWNVVANGNQVGTNLITSILGGCAVQEDWTGAKGSVGRSLNYYSAADGQWHQVWVGNDGITLNLSGGYADGKMVLAGVHERQGKSIRDRITWSNNEDGTVRQLWEISTDGETWSPIFDGLYSAKD